MSYKKLALTVAVLALALCPLGQAQAEKSCSGSCSTCPSAGAQVKVAKVVKLSTDLTCCPQEAPQKKKAATCASCEKAPTFMIRRAGSEKAPGCCPETAKAKVIVKTLTSGDGTVRTATIECDDDCSECEEGCSLPEMIGVEAIGLDPSTITIVGTAGQEAPGCGECSECSKCKGKGKAESKKAKTFGGRVVDLGGNHEAIMVFEDAPTVSQGLKISGMVGDPSGAQHVEFIEKIDPKTLDLLIGGLAPDMTDFTIGETEAGLLKWVQQEECPDCKTCSKCKKAGGKMHRARFNRPQSRRRLPRPQRARAPMLLRHLRELHEAHPSQGEDVDIQVFVNGKMVYGSKGHGDHDPHASMPHPEVRVLRAKQVHEKAHPPIRVRATPARKAEVIVEKIGMKGAVGTKRATRRGKRTLKQDTAIEKKRAKKVAPKRAKKAAPKPPKLGGMILRGPLPGHSDQAEMKRLQKDIEELRASLRKLQKEIRGLNQGGS